MSLLNDPNEGTFRLHGFRFEKLLREEKEHDQVYARLDRYRNILKNSVYIFSISQAENNQAMWAYYAKNHTGVRIEYDIPDNLDELTSNAQLSKNLISSGSSKLFHDVRYSDDSVVFDFPNIPSDMNEFYKLYYAAITTKCADWVGELEKRIIIRLNNIYEEGVKIPLKEDYVRSIVFGCNISEIDLYSHLRRIKRKYKYFQAIKMPGVPVVEYMSLD